VSSRSYLSIGDVLTLLREEFPDVTISKIRFLESQGLVNPERSPSGYRKFFEPDVERLRWVLRQQREHFLPLKVIRDRLAAGNLDDIEDGPEVEPAHRNGVTGSSATAGAPASVGATAGHSDPRSPTVVGHPAGGTKSVPGRTEAQLAQADNEAMARILADASRRAALIPDGGDRAATQPPAADSPSNVGAVGAVRSIDAGAGVASAATAGPGQDRSAAAVRSIGGRTVGHEAVAASGGPDAAARRGGKSGERDGGGAAAARPPESRPRSNAPAAAAPTPARADGPAGGDGPASSKGGGSPSKSKVPASMVSGASLTADELCAASGLSETELAGLQSFGLLDPVIVAGIPTYDEDALTVANLAADFRKFGIEPRHLRMYRNAIDREIGLIEQVIIPLLRQRNPESRQRALDAADELGTLGQTMRATLLRAALRRHIGG
jgi:DNA-binding transcriptional MerR regulator